MGLNDLTRSRGYKRLMSILYGVGASIVILGALFKIIHVPYANEMLIAGMTTEAIIFFFSAFEPPHVEPDWSLVHPELEFMYHGTGASAPRRRVASTNATAELDNLLEKAKIGPDLIESLGTGIRNLSDNAGKMADISNAALATGEFTQNMNNASRNVNDLNRQMVLATESANQFAGTYQKSASDLARAVEKMDVSGLDNRAYSDQLQRISGNLSALNNLYEIQLKNSNSHMEAASRLNSTINQYLETVAESSREMSDYKQEIENLTKKVAALNNVYGNMLAAMNVNMR